MRSNATRIICGLLGFSAVLQGYVSWIQGDWRELIGAAALAQLALVLWLAMPPGAAWLRRPTAGTRGMRIALYTSLLATGVVASMPWPAGFDDSRGSDSALILAIAAVVTAPFFQAEIRSGATS